MVAAANDFESFNIIHPDDYAAYGYPHHVWTRLRREDPVHWWDRTEGIPFWAITKHADVQEISKLPDFFLNGPRLTISHEPEEDDAQSIFPPTLIQLDPPKHGIFRKMVSTRFTPRMLKKIDADIEQIGREIVEELVKQLVRSAVLILTITLLFVAIAYIPLADAIAISFMAPLFITILAVPILKEPFVWHRFGAVLAGLGGVVIIMQPGAGVLHWAAFMALGSGFFFALFQIMTRKLAASDDWFTTLFYTGAGGLFWVSLGVGFFWRPLDLEHVGVFAVMGLLAAGASAVRINPVYEKALVKLGISLRAVGEIDRAIRYFRQALEVNPDDVRLHYQLGLIFAEKHLFDLAVDHFEKAEIGMSDNPDVQANLALALQNAGLTDRAETSWQTTVEMDAEPFTPDINLN